MATEDQSKQSRREKRRAEKAEAAAAEAEEREQDAALDQDEGDDDADEPALGADAGDDEPAAEARDDAAKKKSKKKKKKRADADDESPEEIRDRNKRMRAAAAARRRAKRDRERESAAAEGLDASEMVDDALARGTHAATEFIKKNVSVVQWVVVLAIAGGIGWQIYSWRTNKSIEKASDELMEGVRADRGIISEMAAAPEEARRTFPTEQARLEAAEKAYREAAELRKGSGTAILAQLGLAGVLYEQGKYQEAKGAYDVVKGSALANADADVKNRAIEGVGMSLEAMKDYAGALSAFKELETADAIGFPALGLFHQARIAYLQNEKDKTKELLKKVQDRLDKDRGAMASASYLENAARELLALVDPTAVPPPSAASYSPEQIEAMKEQIMKDPTKLQQMLQQMQNQATNLAAQAEKIPGPTAPAPAPAPAPTPTETPAP